MIDTPHLFELIKTGAIDTYKGTPEVLADKRNDLVVIGQGDERILVLTFEQTMDLIGVLIYKLEGGA